MGSQKGGFPKGGFGGCSPVPKTRNEGAFACSPGTKTGTRALSHVTPERKPERGYIRQNHPFTKPPFCLPLTEEGNVDKMSKNVEKCPKNVQKLSGGAENTVFGHFLDNFRLFGQCFCLVTLSNAGGFSTKWPNRYSNPVALSGPTATFILSRYTLSHYVLQY